MALKCSICIHPERRQIEVAVTGGETVRHIASRFDVGYAAVSRHNRNCIAQALQKSDIKRNLQTVATVREVLETLTYQMRADSTELFSPDGSFDITDIRDRGLGPMVKSVTFKRESDGSNVVKLETHSQQAAAVALLNAYTKLEITKQLTDAQRLTDRERAERIASILDRGRTRRIGQSPSD